LKDEAAPGSLARLRKYWFMGWHCGAAHDIGPPEEEWLAMTGEERKAFAVGLNRGETERSSAYTSAMNSVPIQPDEKDSSQ
jgi:hypothetical protein